MKKEIITYNKRDASGNIYVILAKVRTILRKQSRITEYNECWEAVSNANSYEEAIQALNKYVELKEIK